MTTPGNRWRPWLHALLLCVPAAVALLIVLADRAH